MKQQLAARIPHPCRRCGQFFSATILPGQARPDTRLCADCYRHQDHLLRHHRSPVVLELLGKWR